jgi:hypothetical protein
MKYGVLILAGMFLMAATVPATAQESGTDKALYNPGPYPHVNIKRIVKNFESGLRSSNDGIQESTLSHIIWLRLVRPDANLEPLQDKIAELVSSGRTPSIRYRAALAEMVLDSPALFAGMATVSYTTANEVFATVSDVAKQTLIGYNR